MANTIWFSIPSACLARNLRTQFALATAARIGREGNRSRTCSTGFHWRHLPDVSAEGSSSAGHSRIASGKAIRETFLVCTFLPRSLLESSALPSRKPVSRRLSLDHSCAAKRLGTREGRQASWRLFCRPASGSCLPEHRQRLLYSAASR